MAAVSGDAATAESAAASLCKKRALGSDPRVGFINELWRFPRSAALI